MIDPKLLWLRNAICIAIAVVLFLPLSASAQGKGKGQTPAQNPGQNPGQGQGGGAALPVGFWVTKPPSEQFLIAAGACRFTAYNASGVMVQVIEGTCSWQASSAGGILTINNVHSYKSAPIRYSVALVNSTTITVFGDVFYKGIMGTVTPGSGGPYTHAPQ